MSTFRPESFQKGCEMVVRFKWQVTTDLSVWPRGSYAAYFCNILKVIDLVINLSVGTQLTSRRIVLEISFPSFMGNDLQYTGVSSGVGLRISTCPMERSANALAAS